jgi:putative transposase
MSTLQQEFSSLSIRQLCGLLGVSRSWVYARPHALTQVQRDVALRDAIERIVLEFPGYGYRRVTEELHRQQWAVNHKRVLRLMRQEALLCQLQRTWMTTTDSRHTMQTYPNLLSHLPLTRPNQAWVADITYIRLPSTFIYLACVLDAWSRRCVGWQLSRTIDTELTLAALDRAIVLRQPPAGLIHHSDRGVQYASTAYIERLLGIGAEVSMSAKGNPYDTAKAESFFKTLKREEV